MTPRAVLLASALALTLLRPSRVADACSCIAPPMIVLPTLDAPAPLDTHVWLRGPSVLALDLWDEKGHVLGKTDREVELRTAPLPDRPSVRVPTTTTEYGDHWMPTVELVPSAPLAPRSVYEVWLVDRSPFARTILAGAFRTGAERDASPPAWGGLTGARVDDPMWPHATITLAGDCGESLYVDLSGPPASDEGPVLYGVWTGAATDALDYSAPPVAILRAGSTSTFLSIGRLGCWPVEVPLPKADSLRVGVVAIDLAGKRSVPSDLVLDLRSPPGQSKRRR